MVKRAGQDIGNTLGGAASSIMGHASVYGPTCVPTVNYSRELSIG